MKTLTLLDIIHNNPHNLNFLRKNLLLNFIRMSNLTEHLNPNKQFKIETTPNLANISAGFYTIQIDMNLLKHSISKNIDADINFTVLINNQVIVTNGEQGSIFIENIIHAPFLSIITIILSIREDKILLNKVSLIKTQLLEFILIILPIIIINIIFRKFYLQSIIKKSKVIKLENLDLREDQNLLMRKLKAKSYYNELMISKIKEKIKNEALQETCISDDILCFPLLIEENQRTSIDSVTFFKDLILFFKYSINKKKVDFQYSDTSDVFTVHLSKESFYQLTFSLIYNILYLLGNKSSLIMKLEVKSRRLVNIIITYTGFQLNEDQIQNYTEQSSQGEIFLLNMRYTMKGLKKFGISWDIENKGNDNILQFNFQDINQSSKLNKDPNNVVNLRDYYKK